MSQPLSHSPAPWHRDPQFGDIVGGTARWNDAEGMMEYSEDVAVSSMHDTFGEVIVIKNKADEALILRAPDLYHALKNLVEVVALQVDGDVMDKAQNILAEIERMTNNND